MVLLVVIACGSDIVMHVVDDITHFEMAQFTCYGTSCGYISDLLPMKLLTSNGYTGLGIENFTSQGNRGADVDCYKITKHFCPI